MLTPGLDSLSALEGGTAASLALLDDDTIFPSTSTTSAIAWTSVDASGGGEELDHFEVAIGSSAGATDIVNWTSAGTAKNWSGSGLSLTMGSTYYASVRLIGASGQVLATLNGDGWKVVSPVTVAERHAIAPNWNDYANTATPGSACAGTEVGYYGCIHGGEKKKIDYAAAVSCAGYQAADELGAFDWGCDDTGGAGNVFFYSRGLKKAKGLGDLVNAASWKSNRVVITQGGSPVAASARTTWWSNPVQALTANATSGTFQNLGSAGTIYTVAQSMTVQGGYQAVGASGNRIAVVTLPGAILTFNGTTPDCTVTTSNCVVALNSTYFNWVEGEFRGTGGGIGVGISGNSLRHSVIRRVRVSGFGFGIGGSDGTITHTLLSQIVASNNSTGIRAKGGSSIYQDITAVGNSGNGIGGGDVTNSNYFQNLLVAHNGGNGIDYYGSQNSVFTAVTAVRNGGSGINFSSNTGMTLNSVLVRNNGITIGTGSRTTFSQFSTDSITLNTTSDNKFTGNWVSGAAPLCSVTAGTNPGLVNATCANSGSSNATATSSSGTFSLVGAVTSEDAANDSDNTGVMSFASILDWVSFDHFLRGWGAPAGGRCTSGTCQIWDFRLSALDTQVRNTTANGSAQNASFNNGDPCPAFLNGNVTSVDVNASPKTFLRNAIEILGSGGNNNGLCESNETCLYTPNFGAYQGSGDYLQKSCVFSASGGPVTGVTIYAYPDP